MVHISKYIPAYPAGRLLRLLLSLLVAGIGFKLTGLARFLEETERGKLYLPGYGQLFPLTFVVFAVLAVLALQSLRRWRVLAALLMILVLAPVQSVATVELGVDLDPRGWYSKSSESTDLPGAWAFKLLVATVILRAPLFWAILMLAVLLVERSQKAIGSGEPNEFGDQAASKHETVDVNG